IKEVEA
ncbi:hypothetical protein A2U01_0073683, partial [Trifolium medium]|nr:hypothetical protein [Trifolium medium]